MRSLATFCTLLVLSVTATTIAHAASFDCTKAKLVVEYTICGNAELSSLDDQLAVRYQETMKAAENKGRFEEDQRKWLATRNSCKDVECLREVYTNRISDLGGQTSHTEEEQLPGSEAASVDQRFFGRYIGVATNTTYNAHGQMSIDIEQSNGGGYQLKMKAWNGIGGEGVYDSVKISSDGHLLATGKFSDMPFGAIGVFRQPRFWNSNITGVIIGNIFRGNYILSPVTVGSVTDCGQIPGMRCMYTDEEQGKFELKKFEPLVKPQ